MTKDLNDDLSDMLTPGKTFTPKAPPANYKPVDFSEPCPKCRGTGRFVSYSGRTLGPCFTCKGAGKQTFKTSTEARAKARDQRHVRKATNEASNVVEFKAAHPAIWAWIEANPSFEFAMSLRNAVAKYGYLTEKQMAAAERGIARDAARKTEAQARVENAPVVETAGIDRLKEAFDTAVRNAQAKARGLTIKHPKITAKGLTISPAKAHSTNPGAIYVKTTGGTYLGKIVDGKFLASFICTPEQQAEVLKFVADPKAAAVAYGQETGVCCICNAELRSEWRLRGIGPICAEKYGWGAE